MHMYRIVAILIGIAFLGYGLLRLGVGSALLAQEVGFIEIDGLKEPLIEVDEFLSAKAERALIPVNVAGYVGFIALMGLTLTIGAIGSLANERFGLPFIGAFLLMYAALFINFLTINPKIVHLGVCFLLFLCLWWIKTYRGTRDESN